MNDASNVIITNNQSDLTRIKFAKANNKISTVVKVSEIVQKTNQINSMNNNNNTKYANKNNNHQKNDISSNKNSLNGISKSIIQNKEQKNLNTSINFVEKNYFFLKLNRFCPLKIKIVILIIFLFCSILFLCINTYDNIIYWKKEKNHDNKECLPNNCIIFFSQIIGSLVMLFFYFIIFFINQGENHNFIIILSIISIIIFSTMKIFVFIKNIKISISIIFNLFYSLFILLINLILFMLMMVIKKKKKNVLHNIDEIVYFTENNMQTQKKGKDINYINNSPNNNILKKATKSVQLVEDDNELKNKNDS